MHGYAEIVSQTEGMVRDRESQDIARRHGLQILNVTWEDTGRFKGSEVGPNISDMTIQVQQQLAGTDRCELTCMPVIRYPNFADVSADISPDQFYVLVGNEKGLPLERITLRELLENLREHLHDPASWSGNRTSLLSPERDSHVLVSAQACFLPIDLKGGAEFNPVLFNYQATKGDPAVLAILATREGTSVTVIDNQRDGFRAGRTWGQRLFFSQNGERCSLTGRRQSDFIAEAASIPGQNAPPMAGAVRPGLNLVLLIQVPLRQKNQASRDVLLEFCDSGDDVRAYRSKMRKSNVENAVIGHGRVEGPFTEIDSVDMERDDRYPVRVTVQFYKATTNGVVSEDDMVEIAAQINRVYEQADYVGSLVVEGATSRPTEHTKLEPPGWWNEFWQRHLKNTGQTKEDAIAMLTRLFGTQWAERPLGEIEDGLRRN